jgi:hypothetical protein
MPWISEKAVSTLSWARVYAVQSLAKEEDAMERSGLSVVLGTLRLTKPGTMKAKLVLTLVTCGMLWAGAAASQDAAGPPRGPSHFVPNSQAFWDFSENWTTNYGPAYRDTVLAPSNFLECTGQFALCFHSGAEPLPCRLTADGRFANCTCDVLDGPNFVLITAILNHPVYLATIDPDACGPDGTGCQSIEYPQNTQVAPVCEFLTNGNLIPGAQVISTYDPDSTTAINDATSPPGGTLKNCNGPFAGCMTAPCKLNKDGTTAQCLCPVFYGNFQLVGEDAQCALGGDLVPSASYNPAQDPTVP